MPDARIIERGAITSPIIWTRAVSVTVTDPVSSVSTSEKLHGHAVDEVSPRAPAEPPPIDDIAIVEDGKVVYRVVRANELDLPEPGAAVDEERRVDMVEDIRDEVLDRSCRCCQISDSPKLSAKSASAAAVKLAPISRSE